MKPGTILTITSLISTLLFLAHLADDIVHGIEAGDTNDLIGGTAIIVVWLYGTLMLRGRLVGCLITLVGGLLSFTVAYLHMSGKGVGEIAQQSGGLFFVWTLLALGVTGVFAIILSLHAVWGLWRSRSE